MSLSYECPTCKVRREASISSARVFYMIDNLLITLDKESDDCDNCKKQIEQAQEIEREKIRTQSPVEETI